MASIRKEIGIDATPAEVWDALRDVGALHTRLVKGFVVDCRLDGEARTVQFANGMTARELIIDVSDGQRRVAWSATGGRLTHHNASAQVQDDGTGRSRVVWLADLLPHEMAPAIAGMIEQGLQAMRRTLEGEAVSTEGDWRGG
ncbi:MAG TPA: SRPBCC family protein [Ideonella sp.]|uniref:SRPBCC family protein n=1 Tax=Ideonella sp. TaxID=1929293 RepID=UPI002E374D29|nr:SRPBCC family protein [Ideonella sp.]HEX5684147.1 SRPBCC family protein [Ideonella sp.]